MSGGGINPVKKNFMQQLPKVYPSEMFLSPCPNHVDGAKVSWLDIAEYEFVVRSRYSRGAGHTRDGRVYCYIQQAEIRSEVCVGRNGRGIEESHRKTHG